MIGFINKLKKSSIHFIGIITRIDNYLFKRLFLICVKCFQVLTHFVSVVIILPVPRKSLSDAKNADSIQKTASKGNLLLFSI